MKAFYYRSGSIENVDLMISLCKDNYQGIIETKKIDENQGILFAENDFYDCLENILPLIIHDTGTNFTFLVSHCECDLSLLALEKAVSYSNSCIYLCDLIMECILHQDHEIYEVIRSTFKGVDRESMQSAKMYVDCGMNVTLAASKLYVHRNTFNYRLNKFMRLTNLDIKEFHDALYLYIVSKIL